MFRCKSCLGRVDDRFIHEKTPNSFVRYVVNGSATWPIVVWTLWMEQYEDLDTLAPPMLSQCDVMKTYAQREEGVYVTVY